MHPRWVFVLLLWFAGPTAAVLSSDVEKPEKVRVSVIAILATEQNNQVEACLNCIAREVRKLRPKLTGFRTANLCCKSLDVGTPDKFELVADQVARVTVQHAADKKNRVQLKVTPPRMGEITYETCCGKFLPIVTPFRTHDKELLIIAIRVQPCHGK